ncbi:unnamed protein product [Allacma fusca]|uniref:Ribosomal protein L7Ae/L30e/S12e/Gadd45 domain-containing protein n=1 Tax=Allacma fusca TaxID=39272 RepID=A0A8J2KIK2_9HEXA|nr:unnamed protein product [Allacma fusca]
MSAPPDISVATVSYLSNTRKRKSIGETAKREKTFTASTPKSKTMVVHPNEIVWPMLSEEDNTKLLKEISDTLRILKNPIGKPSLQQVREVPKPDRKHFRKDFKLEEAMRLNFKISNFSQIRASLAIGVNCVSKKLESDQLSAMLVDPDVDPPYVTKLLVPMARMKLVPVIAVRGLESTMNSVAEFRCVAVGLKTCCEESTNYFNTLLKTIREYSQLVATTQVTDPSVQEIPPSRYIPSKIRRLAA